MGGRRLIRVGVKLGSSCSDEGGAIGSGELQPVRDHASGFGMGRTSEAAFEVTDGASAQSGTLSQVFLTETSRKPVSPDERGERWWRFMRHPRFPGEQAGKLRDFGIILASIRRM